MEICQEKVCCVSLKTKQVVAGQDQGIKVVKIKVVKIKVVGMTKEPITVRMVKMVIWHL